MSMRSLLPILILALVVPSGCDKTPPKPASGKPRVGLVMKSLANEFFKTMADGAQAHQKAHAGTYELEVTGMKNETDVAEQIRIVEQMISRKLDAIVIAPADSKALVTVCKRAQDAGIVVVNIDNKLDDAALAEKGIKVPFVGPNNRHGAKLAGEYLAKQLQKGDGVAILEGRPGAFNGIQRRDGFREAMDAAGMKILASQSADWEQRPAQNLARQLLVSHPDLKAILCANDSMALGAHVAVKDAQKLGQVKIVGYDNIAAVKELIRKGEVLCTVDQHGDQIGVYGIEYALEILKNKSTPTDKETPVELVK